MSSVFLSDDEVDLVEGEERRSIKDGENYHD
jgi:hypothetical protein